MDTILVLCQSRRQSALIARTLRYRQVYSLPLALDSRAETVLSYAPKGIVLSANDGMDNALAQVDPALLSAGVPVLALGGMVPALCRFYGGEASPSACPRGAVTLGLEHDPLFTNISGGERVLRSLSDLTLPESLLPLATATERPIGFRHRTCGWKKIFLCRTVSTSHPGPCRCTRCSIPLSATTPMPRSFCSTSPASSAARPLHGTRTP